MQSRGRSTERSSRRRCADTITFASPRLKSQFGRSVPQYPSAHVQNFASAANVNLNSMKPNSAKSPGRVPLPEKIGKYVIINEVGRGSTGVVYLSHDPYYGRDVAIKVYNVDASGDENRKRISRKMFLSEAHMVGMCSTRTFCRSTTRAKRT